MILVGSWAWQMAIHAVDAGIPVPFPIGSSSQPMKKSIMGP